MVGLDEVGRGCMAGPLVAAAVVLDDKSKIPGIKDSKLLTKTQREKLALKIRQRTLAIGIGWVNPCEIDRFGLTIATSYAMTKALSSIQQKIISARIIIDGNYNYLIHPLLENSVQFGEYPPEAIIDADASYPCVSAASIIAKVARDNYMVQMHKLHPAYGFLTHVGYCTRYHRARLKEFGPSVLHRQTFAPVAQLKI
jgi:ribonuclease HII